MYGKRKPILFLLVTTLVAFCLTTSLAEMEIEQVDTGTGEVMLKVPIEIYKEYMSAGPDKLKAQETLTDYYEEQGKKLFGVYNEVTQGWHLTNATTQDVQVLLDVLPENAVGIAFLQGDAPDYRLAKEIPAEAFLRAMPSHTWGEKAFDAAYAAYKPYGFDRYGYEGKNVRGFWDEVTGTHLINLDPVTGGVLQARDDGAPEHVYLQAVYADGVLTGVETIDEGAFLAIPGVQEAAEGLKAAYGW